MTPNPIENFSTEDLVRQFKQGHNREETFRVIYLRHCGMVTRFFQRKGFTREEAVDLMQETFLSASRGLNEFRQEDRFKSWLFTIALNTFRSELERRRAKKRYVRTVSLDQEYLDSDGDGWTLKDTVSDLGPSPAEKLLQQERLTILRRVMQELPDQQRRCVHLRVVQERSYQEIADELGIALGTVKAHIFQAKASLRNRLRQHFDDDDLEL